jgi:tetratricopeptide (TPR) repeat protein
LGGGVERSGGVCESEFNALVAAVAGMQVGLTRPHFGKCGYGNPEECMAGKSRKQQIEEMLAEDPSDAFLRYGLGMEYVGEERFEEAVRCFREAFQADPGYVPAFMQAGKFLDRLGRPQEARAAWEQGIVAARRKGDLHAAEEMQAMLAGLG